MGTVLIVDDDADMRATLAELLRLSGYVVMEADNGRTALERLGTPPAPRVMLLDLMMPVMNGWQVLEWLKTQAPPALAQLPVIVVSALGLQARELSQHFRCEVMGKPVDIDLLLSRLSHYCSAADRG